MTMALAAHGPDAGPAHYAGFLRRALAFLIDGVLLAMIAGMLSTLLLPPLVIPTAPEQLDPTAFFNEINAYVHYKIMIAYAASVIYATAMEASSVQATVGKMALSMRVTDLAGARISFGRALARNAVKFLVEIGFLLMPFTSHRQALHDIVSGAIVIRTDADAAAPAGA